jgi:hypothetical protein
LGGGGGGGRTNDPTIDAEGGEEEEDDDDVGDDYCYYYPCAMGDVFNQRPLPFVIGSVEFMASGCAGLDDDDVVEHRLVR